MYIADEAVKPDDSQNLGFGWSPARDCTEDAVRRVWQGVEHKSAGSWSEGPLRGRSNGGTFYASGGATVAEFKEQVSAGGCFAAETPEGGGGGKF